MRLAFVLLACVTWTCHAADATRSVSEAHRNRSTEHSVERENRRPRITVQAKPAIENPIRVHREHHPSLNARPARALTAVRATAPSFMEPRYRGANTAVLNGSASLNKRNGGTIDGRQVHRRP